MGLLDFPSEFYTYLIRIVLIVILSGIIGIERESKNHPAGLRTHILVGVGSCLLMLVSLYGFEPFLEEHPKLVGFDPSRIPSYVISGIGFLGAGTIMVHGGVTVRGLTTAASIWVVAGLGLVVGIGMYYEAILTTFIIVITLMFLNKFEAFYKKRVEHKKLLLLSLVVQKGHGNISSINNALNENGIEITQYQMENDDEMKSEGKFKYTLIILTPSVLEFNEVLEVVQELDCINKVQLHNK
ncbi:MgtC/SapB family protein [Rossellomorea aquimaris]|uniref:MgtC/SapB family protein n=1 Tax=Rossellomorea aquimaris TaxID=189382 RepID=UPI0007D0799D|nr:MgtC/SapB family protein [Rossellomorea aquimaris]